MKSTRIEKRSLWVKAPWLAIWALFGLSLVIPIVMVAQLHASYEEVSEKWRAHCLFVRSKVDVALRFWDAGSKIEGVDRFARDLDDVERCAELPMQGFARCDSDACRYALMKSAHEGIASE